MRSCYLLVIVVDKMFQRHDETEGNVSLPAVLQRPTQQSNQPSPTQPSTEIHTSIVFTRESSYRLSAS